MENMQKRTQYNHFEESTGNVQDIHLTPFFFLKYKYSMDFLVKYIIFKQLMCFSD